MGPYRDAQTAPRATYSLRSSGGYLGSLIVLGLLSGAALIAAVFAAVVTFVALLPLFLLLWLWSERNSYRLAVPGGTGELRIYDDHLELEHRKGTLGFKTSDVVHATTATQSGRQVSVGFHNVRVLGEEYVLLVSPAARVRLALRMFERYEDFKAFVEECRRQQAPAAAEIEELRRDEDDGYRAMLDAELRSMDRLD